MKKRFLALTILMTMCISGCSRNTDTPTESKEPTSPSAEATETTETTDISNLSDEEIKEHINEIGESYDGIYQMAMPDTNAATNSSKGILSGILDNINGYSSTPNNSAYTDGYTDAGVVDGWDESSSGGYVYIPEEPIDWNTENYNNIEESGFVSVSTQPFSTFGADVDTASYTTLRKKLFNEDDITEDAIRVEEMINYFNYDYTEPEKDEKFGVETVLTQCPWNDDTMLLRVGIKAEDIKTQKGSNIVFLIDTSGSMLDNDKLPLVQKAFKILAKNLTKDDTVSIVTYAGNWDVVLEGESGDNYDTITEALESLEANGATNGSEGINKAYEIAEKYFIDGGNNRVILATDGDLNVGVTSESDLIELIDEKKETGVFLSCLGFGTGNYQDDKMEALADHGNGNYSYIDCSREAERVLRDELWSTIYTVAKDVKLQVEFNPSNVKGYRLIGYENREMAAEDFSNDAKDGGEVGAGQCVTVLYEVVLADSDYKIPEVQSRYGNTETEKDSTVESDELLAVNIRYKEPDSNSSELKVYPVTKDMISEMDADTSWAAGVAQVGMILRDSEFKGTSTYEDVYSRLSSDSRIMSDDFRAEFLYMISKFNASNDED